MKNTKSYAAFESLFDEFIDELGGQRLDKLYPEVTTAGIKNADYYLQSTKTIVELKTLVSDHGDRQSILSIVSHAAKELKLPQTVVSNWQAGKAPLPRSIRRIVDRKVQNSLKNVARKANEQLRKTERFIGSAKNKILVVANLQETLFGPAELLKYLAGHMLERKNPSTDAIILLTPGVAYSSFGAEPEHYCIPVYADGKTHLGEVAEPMIKAWIEFEAKSLGVAAEIEITDELDRKTLSARPV